MRLSLIPSGVFDQLKRVSERGLVLEPYSLWKSQASSPDTRTGGREAYILLSTAPRAPYTGPPWLLLPVPLPNRVPPGGGISAIWWNEWGRSAE